MRSVDFKEATNPVSQGIQLLWDDPPLTSERSYELSIHIPVLVKLAVYRMQE